MKTRVRLTRALKVLWRWKGPRGTLLKRESKKIKDRVYPMVQCEIWQNITYRLDILFLLIETNEFTKQGLFSIPKYKTRLILKELEE